MNVRSKLLAGCCTLFALAPFIGIEAQRRPQEVPRLAVMTFKSQEPELGYKAAELLRDRITGAYSDRQLFVIPAQDNNNVLGQSGFDTLEALPGYEENSLGNHLRAKEYISGSIDRTSDNAPYRVEAFLVVPLGKENIMQPLPVIEDKRLNKAMDLLRDAIREARKQMDGDRECRGKGISRDYSAALIAGRAGVLAYPKSTVARLCVAQTQFTQFSISKTLVDSSALADSTMVTLRELLQIDSANIPTLKMAVELYRFKNDTAQLLNTLLELVRADPSDQKLTEQVVFELAKTGNSRRAIPYVKEMVERNPGDPSILKTAFVVFYDAEDYASTAEIGPELIRADTSAADTSYFLRMAHAYTELQQAQKAAETFAEASSRFPGNKRFVFGHYKALLDAGQTQQAIEVLRRYADRDPSATDAVFLLVDYYGKQKVTDSVYLWIEKGSTLASAENKQKLSQLAVRQASLSIANGQAGADKPADTVQINLGMRFAQLSDRINPSDASKLMMGNATLILAQVAATDAMPAKSCPLAQSANQHLTTAKGHFASVAATSPLRPAIDATKANVDELTTAVEYEIKTFCK